MAIKLNIEMLEEKLKKIHLYQTGEIKLTGVVNSIICYQNLCKKGSNY